ncbi:MAG: putative peptidase [Marinoscillum sp.]|jgi:predicted peptidase
MNKIVTSAIFLFAFFASKAQSEYGVQVYKNQGEALNYRILYPENFSSDKSYPIILFLHGSGERGDDNTKQLVHGSRMFIDSSFRKAYPCVVIFPQCPKEDYWSNADVDRNPGGFGLIFKNLGEPTQAMALLVSMMDSIADLKYSRDNQIYVGGLSMGGMGTYEILARRPNMFAAAFPICGGGNTEAASLYAKKVDLWVFHGAKDDVVLPSNSVDMVIALRKAGGNAKFTLYKDANHNSWDSTFAEPGLMSWLFSNVKNQ